MYLVGYMIFDVYSVDRIPCLLMQNVFILYCATNEFLQSRDVAVFIKIVSVGANVLKYLKHFILARRKVYSLYKKQTSNSCIYTKFNLNIDVKDCAMSIIVIFYISLYCC